MPAPTFDEFAGKASSLYPEATEGQIREAYQAKYGRTPVRAKGPSRDEFAARARSLYPDIGDDQIAEAYEAKYGAGFLTETKRTLASQVVAPTARGLGAIAGGFDRLLGDVPGTGLFDRAGEALFNYGQEVQRQNAPSAALTDRSLLNPYRLGQNVIGGIGQIAPAILTGGASIAPFAADEASNLTTELERQGMDPTEARLRGTGYGFASAALERVGLGRLIPKRLPGRIKAGLQEGSTEVAQNVARNVASDKPALEGFGESVAGEGLPAGLAAAIFAPGGRRARAATHQEAFAKQAGLEAVGQEKTQAAPDRAGPEPLRDLEAQAREVGKTRRGVYLAPENQGFTAPGLVELPTPDGGTLLVREEDQAAAQAALAGAQDEATRQAVIGEWTGSGAGKPLDPNAQVVQAIKNGAVIRETAVPPAEAQATAKRMAAELKVQTRVVTPAEALARRARIIQNEDQSPFKELGEDELLRRTDPEAFQQRIRARPIPPRSEIPREIDRLFETPEGSILVPIGELTPTKERRTSSGALKFMQATARGEWPKRAPLSVKVDGTGTLKVEDGNGTLGAAKFLKFDALPANIELATSTPEGRAYERRLAPEARVELARLARDAEAYLPQFRQTLEDIAETVTGARVSNQKTVGALVPKIKSNGRKAWDRIAEKVVAEDGGDWRKLKDMARATILVENKAQAEQALQAVLQAFGQAPGTKIRRSLLDAQSFADVVAMDPYGYGDIKVNVNGPNGRVYEVQITTPGLFDAKQNGPGHDLYETGRKREGQVRDLLRKRMTERMTTANPDAILAAVDRAVDMFRARDPEMQRLFGESRAAYRQAWERFFASSAQSARQSASEMGSPSALTEEGVTGMNTPEPSALNATSPDTTAGAPSTLKNSLSAMSSSSTNGGIVATSVAPYNIDANRSSKAAMSPTELAKADSTILNEEMLTLLRSGDLSQAQNAEFVARFVSKVPDREGLSQRTGERNAEAIRRAEAAMVAKAYGADRPEVSFLLDRLYESSDEGVRRITNALKLAAFKWSELRLALESGRVAPDYDMAGELLLAYNQVREGRAKGLTPEQIRAQGDLTMTPERAAFIEAFYKADGKEQPTEVIAAQLIYTAQQAAAQRSDQIGMFNELDERVAPADIVQSAVELIGRNDTRPDLGKDGTFLASRPWPRRGMMDTHGVRLILDRLRDGWDPDQWPTFIIVQSPAELPPNVLASLGPGINGATDLNTGRIYLVADNIVDSFDAERVIIHETIGHYGFMRLWGDRWPKLVEDITRLSTNDATIRRVAEDILRRYPKDMPREHLVAEIVAHVAETRPKHPLAKRIIAQFREVLRKLGFKINLSRNDLVHLIRKAADAMKDPRGPGYKGPRDRNITYRSSRLYGSAEFASRADRWANVRPQPLFSGHTIIERGTNYDGRPITLQRSPKGNLSIVSHWYGRKTNKSPKETQNADLVLRGPEDFVMREWRKRAANPIRTVDQKGRPIPEGQQELPELDTGDRQEQQAPDFALERPEGQVRPPAQGRLFASRPADGPAGPTGTGFQGPPAGAPPAAPGGRGMDVGGGSYSLNQYGRLTDQEMNVLRSVMGSLQGAIEAERGGRDPQPWDATERQALDMIRNQTGLVLDSLVNRKPGAAANAAQLEAYAQVIARLNQDLTAAAQRVAASRNPSSEDLARVAELREKLGMMLAPAMGYATEAGRSLNILRKVAGDLRTADDILAQLGDGTENAIKDFSKRVADADGDINKVLGVTRASYTPTWWDKFYEYWINGLLSGPTTHTVNMVSNAVFNVLEQATEVVAGIAAPDKVPLRSAAARAASIPHGITLGLKNAKTAFLEERAVLTPEDKLELNQHAIGGELGKIVRLPGRALQAEDEFFKAIAYQGTLSALAMDEAIRKNPRDPMGEHARIMGNILSRPDLIRKAKDEAARLTFTTPLGPIGQAVTTALNKSKVGRVIVPFVRTPTNILKRALEFTPAAPVFAQVRADLMGGGRDQAMAWSRMAVGSSIMMGVAMLAAQGLMSGAGPDDESERAQLMRQGWRPYSVKVPGIGWVKYNRFEPMGMLLGLGADMAEMAGVMSEGEYEAVASMLVTSLATNLGDKTFLRGISDFAAAYSDPKRYMERWANGLATSPIPNVVAQTARWLDPYQREANGILENARAKIPGASTALAQRLDLAGDPIERDSGAPGNPFQVGKPREDVLARTMLELGVRKNAVSRNLSINGASYELRGEAFESYKGYVQKARWNVLTPLVNSPQFRQLRQQNPLAAQALLERQYDEIGRQARMAWIFQNPGFLTEPKQRQRAPTALGYDLQ